jgi:hypothetical protein
MFRNAKMISLLLALALIAAPAPLSASWPNDGRGVCTVVGTQDSPTIVSDGAGGAIVVWRDNRGINTDIYVQRVDPNGVVLWLTDAMPVCTAQNVQSLPLIVADGSGGAIIAWQDFRSNNVLDIYAQRVNSSGYVQWTANGVPVCTGQTGLTMNQMIPDGAGGAIITWYDRRNATNDIFAQRISGAGVVAWTTNGITVCAAAGSQTNPVIASDGAGGAILAWQDQRSGNWNIYAQRINATGVPQWTADGIVICDAAQSQSLPQVISDGAGGAIIAWQDHRNAVDDDLYAQRVDAGGTALWTANGASVVSSMTGNQRTCRVAPAGPGEALVAWVDYRSGTADIYAQKMDAGGTPIWTANGAAVCAATGNQLNVQLISDGSGGAVATWEDERSGTGAWDLYAQRFSAGGSMAWTANGVSICGAAAGQTTPQLCPDGYGGAIIAWRDDRAGNADIYAQRVDAGGHTVLATILQSYRAEYREGGVVVAWTLSEIEDDAEFFVARACGPDAAYIGLEAPSIEKDAPSFSFTDTECESDAVYRYRIDVSDRAGRRVLFETDPISVPRSELALYQNTPNPFNPSTTIGYRIPQRSRVTLEVFDIEGRLIASLVSSEQSAGAHRVVWNAMTRSGDRVASGVYYYRLIAGKETVTRKMVLMR